MKLWEVIKELTEDPTKVFKNENGYSVKFTNEGILAWVDGRGKYETTFTVNKNTADNWQLVRQPVTWQEAIQEFAKGKKLIVKFNNQEWTLEALLEVPNYLDWAITIGKWYVED